MLLMIMTMDLKMWMPTGRGKPIAGTVSLKCEHKTYLLDPIMRLIPSLSETKGYMQCWKLKISDDDIPIWTLQCLEAEFSFSER